MPRHPDTVITPNTVLSAARERIPSPRRAGQCMSRSELADEVNTALDQLYPNRNLTAHYVDARWIGKLERGEHRWPSDERRAALRHVLNAATDTHLDLYSPRRTDGVRSQVHMSGPEQGWLSAEAATTVVAATGGYIGFEQVLISAAHECSRHASELGRWTLPNGVIDQLGDDVRSVARRFATLTAADVVHETLRIRNDAAHFAQQTQRPAQLNELYLTLGQAVALLASASIDLSLWTPAQQYARAAYEYGVLIGHAGVRVYALGLLATEAYWTGRPAEAVGYATEAAELAPSGIARVRALSILARAWSHRGSAEEVRHALGAADDARSIEGADALHDHIGGEFGYSAPQQMRSASTAWLQVGLTREAAAAAERALNALAESAAEPWSTVEAEASVDLATCQLLAEDADAARDTLAALWSMPPGWRRAGLLGRVQRVHDIAAADRWRPVPAAREIAGQASAFAATAGSPPELPSA